MVILQIHFISSGISIPGDSVLGSYHQHVSVLVLLPELRQWARYCREWGHTSLHPTAILCHRTTQTVGRCVAHLTDICI